MENQFNLLDVFKAVAQHKKFIVSFVLASLLIASIALLIVPKQYKAETIIVPANPNLADKSRLSTQNNIQHLYPFFGSDADLDILLGFLQLPQLHQHLTTKFKLIEYYKLQEKTEAKNIYRANKLLKEDLQIIKNENNQVTITLWMKDAKLAADICNETANFINEYIKQQWKLQGEKEIKAIENLIEKNSVSINKKNDLVTRITDTTICSLPNSSELVANYLSMQTQLKLALQTMPNALYIVQPATIAPIADKPNKLITLIAVFFGSIAFGIFMIIVFYKKQL
jgi:LPS O-antigen subunit length determinant protein (WzzB/FepE family)